jgi:prepilin-type processing-associated H-X9-DG protein
MQRFGLANLQYRRAHLVGAICACAISLAGATGGHCAAREADRPLARYFPSDGLFAYAEFDGLSAHADLWHKSATYKLLTETTAGAMLQGIIIQLADRSMGTTPDQGLSGKDICAVAEHVTRFGFAFGVVGKPDPKPKLVGFVFRNAAQGKVRTLFDKLVGLAAESGSERKPMKKPGGRTVFEQGTSPGQAFVWWTEGDDLVFSFGSPAGTDLMIAALEHEEPDATAHPVRAVLAKPKDGFKPIGMAFIESTLFPNLPPQAAAYGLDRIKRIEHCWGFQGEAIMTITRALVPAPRSGLLALFDQTTFGRTDVAPLPGGLVGVTAWSLDLAGLYDRVAAGFAATDPATRGRFEAFETRLNNVTGHRLRDDVLPELGSRMTFYVVPDKVNAPSNILAGLMQGLVLTPSAALVIEMKDRPALARALDDVFKQARTNLDAGFAANPAVAVVRVRPLPGADHGWVVSIPASIAPLPAGLKPTIVLGKTHLIVATALDVARAALASEGQAAGALPEKDLLAQDLGRLPDGLIFANINDCRRSLFPELIPNLPGLIPLAYNARGGMGTPRFLRGGPPRPMGPRPPLQLEIDPDKIPASETLRRYLFPSVFTLGVDDEGMQFVSREAFPAFNPLAMTPGVAALLLPAVRSSRSAAERAQSVNNLKQIGLAMHNYHNVNNAFPPPALVDSNGKPLLSWRVAILPYIGQRPLYNEFKFDEPWDSAHNKALINRMPPTFAVPGTNAETGKTFYRGFSGDQCVFDPKLKDGTPINTVTDGTSNTVAVVEAKTAVIWTKPDEELPLPPGNDAAKLLGLVGGHFPGGFNALFLDGSVRFLKMSINPAAFRAIVTRNGGEVVSADSF